LSAAGDARFRIGEGFGDGTLEVEMLTFEVDEKNRLSLERIADEVMRYEMK